jgi:hypothetical protein
MAYDGVHGNVVLFDTWGSGQQTLTWDGGNWTQQSPTNSLFVWGGEAIAGYFVWGGEAMAGYPATHSVLPFGGSRGILDLNGSNWTWNGSNWIGLA